MTRTHARKNTEPAANAVDRPPGPDGLPVIGSTVSFVRDPLDFVRSIGEYGDVASYEAFGREFVAVSNPELVEAVLVSRDDEFWKGEFESEFGDIVAPDGVFYAEGSDWQRQRRLLQSLFTPKRIESYAADMVDETVRLVEGWADGTVVNVRDALSMLTLGVLTRSLLDLDLDDERADVVVRMVHALGEYVDAEMLGVRAALPSWLPSKPERKFDRAMADLDALVESLVHDHRESKTESDDLLSLLAMAEYPDGTKLSPSAVSDQLVQFLVAGHETSATALTYSCWLIANNPATQRRLACEVDTVCGDHDPTIDDLGSLTLSEAVINESMRLYPPFPFIHRQPHEPTTLGGYRISPESTLQLPLSSVHLDERWWHDAESFRPDRWLPEAEQNGDWNRDRPEYAYFPFGGGPRHCIGMRFAMTELQLVLATMVRRMEFEPVTESIDPTWKVSLDPGPVKLRVHVRDR
ncbi:cytochrome P450 [Natronolimnohabitans innermongolicus]|uniref:Cytochrome P450 n=1 Tax=Natronolimnohabitans innermongolicus JCM 12255 TaxID=1227499 RepID=L9X1N4_9EURY|nr:cytochrome P450 [Natronolimnohabitans innermongolicus]ELY55635.1 cytochrome P450 [Natronolimnohabitans innermongolicus JCM 12255]